MEGFHWGVMGVCEEGKGRLGVRGVWAGGPTPVPLRCCLHLSRGWGPESGIGAFLPFVVAWLGLFALFVALPLLLLGLGRLLVVPLSPPLALHFLFLNLLQFGEDWPWPYLDLLSPQKGGDALAFRFLLLGGLGLDRPDRLKLPPRAL